MNKLVVLIFIFLALFNELVLSQATDLDKFIYRQEQSYPLDVVNTELAKLEAIGPNHSDKEKVLTKVILMFRRATFLDDQEINTKAYEYISAVYDSNPEFQIPVMLAYKGVARTMIAGALTTLNPIPKVKHLEEGRIIIAEAIAAQEKFNSTDYLTLGYIYFLQGRTFASVPTFLALSKETSKSLKQALSYYKKVKNIKQVMIGNIFYSYGLYYYKKGNVKLAIKNIEKAKKYTDDDIYFIEELDEKIREIKGEG